MAMRPYYQHAGITIYHGDCRDVLPTLTRADALITDPPYGLGRDGEKWSSGGRGGGRKAHTFRSWDAERPDAETFALIRAAGRKAIIWGGNHFADLLPPTEKWLVWDKGQRIAQSDAELAWTSERGALRVYTASRMELFRDGAVHPTQKPLCLMLWCIAELKYPRRIVDPYMGSGTTLVAAKELDCKAVGIDREEQFCEMAARRLCQDVIKFPPAKLPPRPVQATMLEEEATA